MARTAELFDGTKLEFPDNTPDEVISRVAKEQTQKLKAGEGEGPTAAQEAGRIGVKGLVGTVAGLPALAADVAYHGIMSPINSAYRIGQAGAHLLGFGDQSKPFTAEDLNYPTMPASGAVSQLGEAAAGAIGPAPTSPEGRIGEAIGTGAIEALGGSGLFRVAGRIFASMPEAKAFLDTLAAGPKVQAAYGAAAAGGGQAAEEGGLPPIAGTIAGLAAVAGGHAVPGLARAGAARAREALLQTPESQAARAATDLRQAATDKPALEDWARGTDTGELVPGSKPTLYEATGDQGLGRATNTAFQKGADLGEGQNLRDELALRRDAQNEARLAEIESLGGAGKKDALVAEFRRQRQQLDDLGGVLEGQAQGGAEAAIRQGGTAAAPEAVGEAVRGPMEASRVATAQEGNRLYRALEEGGVTVGTGRLKAAIGAEFKDIAESPLSGVERRYAELVRGYGPRLDFERIRKLREDIGSEARKLDTGTTTKRRLKILRDAIDSAMDDGLARAIQDDPSLFQRTAAAAGRHGGDDLAAGARAASGGLPAGAVAPEAGSPRPAVGGLRDDAGGASLPPGEGIAAPAPRLSEAPPAAAAPLEAVDPALTQQYRQTKDYWRQYKQDYGTEPVLGRAKQTNEFKVSDASVPGNVFQGGPAGGERVRAARTAGATDAALIDAAALSMQQQVIRDGVVNPAAFSRWRTNHATALAELPEAARARFQSVADATAVLQRVQAERAVRLMEFDRSAVGRALAIDPDNLVAKIGSALRNPAEARDLARAVGGNAEAQAGLRRLAADYIQREFLDASEDIKKAALTGFLSKNKAALAQIFGGEGAERLARLAADIERTRKLMTVGKDPGGSATAGNLADMAQSSVGGWLATALFGAKAGLVVGGLKTVLGNIRLSGIKSAEELYARALLDPELARKLLTRAPALKSAAFIKSLGRTILKSSLLAAAQSGGR